jgi:hypothetical protein
MNRHVNSCKSAMVVWLSAAVVAVLPVAAAPVAQPAAPEEVTPSVFVIPTNAKEGRDPFFPNSTRMFEDTVSKSPPVGDLSSLVLRGISGPPGHRLAIINNHTFAAGDEGEVITPHTRIHIRCVEIKDNSVVVESGGQRHELSYSNNH